jgi:hypothetical protein
MWKEIVAKGIELVKVAETLIGKTGAEKRAIVVAWLCKAVNIPFVPEWAEGLIEPPAYGFIIDTVVGIGNRITGHALEKMPDDPEAAETMADIVKDELKAAAVGAKADVEEKFNALLEKYRVKAGA